MSAKEERERGLRLLKENANFVKGQRWYVVPTTWYAQWLNYAGIPFDGTDEELLGIVPELTPSPGSVLDGRPGPIDTRGILALDGEYREDKGDAFELRDGLSEDTDFSFVPEAFWQDIVLGEAPVASPPFASSSSSASVERYGLVDGAPAVQRSVFERGGGVDENGFPLPGSGGTIEVKPRLAHVFCADEDTGVATSPFRDEERDGMKRRREMGALKLFLTCTWTIGEARERIGDAVASCGKNRRRDASAARSGTQRLWFRTVRPSKEGASREEEESEDADQEWELALGADAVAVEDYFVGLDQIELLFESARRRSGQDGRASAEYPRDRAWRNRLRVGDLIDAQDRDGKWYDSVVVARGPASDLLGAALEGKDISQWTSPSPAQSSTWSVPTEAHAVVSLSTEMRRKLELLLSNEEGRNGAEAYAVRVHFKGWSSKFDEYKHVGHENTLGSMASLQPRFTRLPDWRSELGEGDFVEVRKRDNKSGKMLWYLASVERVEAEKGLVHVQITSNDDMRLDSGVFDRESEEMCPHPTHQKQSSQTRSCNRTYSSAAGRNTSVGYGSLSKRNVSGAPSLGAGAVGLVNLGNTCYMNAVLQCLLRIAPLRDFFRDQGRWGRELNETNILGSGGKVATAFAALADDFWSNEYREVVPNRLKRSVGEFCATFVGYEQHDAFEFLMALLDALHEDTNRVRANQKPYFERISYREAFGVPDCFLAREELRRELARNQSAVYDLCLGQLACRLTCCFCGAVSRSFDPFTTLQLPIPMNADDASLTASSPTIIHGVFFPRFPGSDTSDSVHGRDNYPHGSRTGGNNVETFAAEFAQTRSCSVMDLKLWLARQHCLLPTPPDMLPAAAATAAAAVAVSDGKSSPMSSSSKGLSRSKKDSTQPELPGFPNAFPPGFYVSKDGQRRIDAAAAAAARLEVCLVEVSWKGDLVSDHAASCVGGAQAKILHVFRDETFSLTGENDTSPGTLVTSFALWSGRMHRSTLTHIERHKTVLAAIAKSASLQSGGSSSSSPSPRSDSLPPSPPATERKRERHCMLCVFEIDHCATLPGSDMTLGGNNSTRGTGSSSSSKEVKATNDSSTPWSAISRTLFGSVWTNNTSSSSSSSLAASKSSLTFAKMTAATRVCLLDISFEDASAVSVSHFRRFSLNLDDLMMYSASTSSSLSPVSNVNASKSTTGAHTTTNAASTTARSKQFSLTASQLRRWVQKRLLFSDAKDISQLVRIFVVAPIRRFSVTGARARGDATAVGNELEHGTKQSAQEDSDAFVDLASLPDDAPLFTEPILSLQELSSTSPGSAAAQASKRAASAVSSPVNDPLAAQTLKIRLILDRHQGGGKGEGAGGGGIAFAPMLVTDHSSVVMLRERLSSPRCVLEINSAAASRTRNVDLSHCLRSFTEMEQLGETEMWRCDHCQQLCRAYKRMELWSAPDVLCLQLKRFSTSGFQHTTARSVNWFGGAGNRFAKRRKIKSMVQYPRILDLAPFVAGPQNRRDRRGCAFNETCDPYDTLSHVYDLVGVVKHSGDLNGGHYTAYARDCGEVEGGDPQRWFSCNDRNINVLAVKDSSIEEQHPLLSKDAYLLFYQRKQLGVTRAAFGGVLPTIEGEWPPKIEAD